MKHIDTAAYDAARQVLNNTEQVWDVINPLFKRAEEESWPTQKLAARIERAIQFMCGYTDNYTPPISRRSLHCWALGTAADEEFSH